jgi:hypothetical protein
MSAFDLIHNSCAIVRGQLIAKIVTRNDWTTPICFRGVFSKPLPILNSPRVRRLIAPIPLSSIL